jgi:lysozyme
MRALTPNEKALIHELVLWRQGKPGPMEAFLVQKYFTEEHPQAVIIQTQRKYAVLYHAAGLGDDDQATLERNFFEMIGLISYLRTSGFITLFRGARTKESGLYYLHATFDKPRVEGTTIHLNAAGDFSTNPEVIFDKEHVVRFKGSMLEGEIYDLILGSLTGTLCVSQALLELVGACSPSTPKLEEPAPKPQVKRTVVAQRAGDRKRPLLMAAAFALVTSGLLGALVLHARAASAALMSMTRTLEALRTDHKVLASKLATLGPAQGKLDASIPAAASPATPPEEEHHGVDVSRWNGDFALDIDRIPGLSFAIVKATEGVTLKDQALGSNRKLLRDRGVPHGYYHFYRQEDDPVAQADFFIATIGELEAGDIAPVLDVEWSSLPRGETVDPARLQVNVLRLLRALEAKTGRRPIVYTGYAFAQTYLTDPAFGAYRLWLAEYSAGAPKVPHAWRNAGYFIWQKSPDYEIGRAKLDLDVYRGSVADLIR